MAWHFYPPAGFSMKEVTRLSPKMRHRERLYRNRENACGDSVERVMDYDQTIDCGSSACGEETDIGTGDVGWTERPLWGIGSCYGAQGQLSSSTVVYS